MLRNNYKIFALVFICIIAVSCSSSYSVHKDVKGKQVVVGKLSWGDWQEAAEWDSYVSKNYIPDTVFINEISSEYSPDRHGFILFGGSWCGDSVEEMPKLYETLSMAGISYDAVALYGLDRDKKEPSGIAAEMNIEKVPTLIIMKDGKEIGRIVETPVKSWEEDLHAALRK